MSSTFRPSAPSKQTVVEEGSCFKGTLTSTCPIHVHGRIEGDLETPSLTVSATGFVHGRAKVGAVRSEGEISGEFDADSIELAGVVRDNTVIRARSLEVKLASTRGKLQVIFGECELAVGAEPTEHDAVDPVATTVEAAPPELPLVPEPGLPLDALPPEASAMIPAPPPVPAEVLEPAAVAAPAPLTDEDDPDDTDDAEVSEAADKHTESGRHGKRRRKRRQNDVEIPHQGWSQPPSQPPPAS